ncbi:MAG: DUF4065 domain-containing protein [Paludibacter sp.]|nr:DUF4065 domain-containing protein [Paludibacter sp.]
MTSPFTGGDAILIKEPREYDFRGSKFYIIHHHYHCIDTKEDYTDARLDNLNLNQVYNQYREKEGIPFPDEITAYRKQYDFPATKMSQMLGFGVNMYGKYESGEIPNSSNGRMINICKDPEIFRNYFISSLSHQFSDKEKESIIKKIDKAVDHKRANINDEYEKYAALGNVPRGILTGFVAPNLEKARQMVVYFACLCSPFTTKMNKLLYYADFLNYKRTGFAISGITYQAKNYGPVPERYDGLYGNVSDIVDRVVEYYSDEKSGERLKTEKEFDVSLFSEEELRSLEKVASRFKNTTTKDIVLISHDETAWIENEANEDFISYQSAFDLKALN